MSWTEWGKFIKKLLLLEDRVGINAKEIKDLREDLKQLTSFTRQVANIVKQNQISITHHKEQTELQKQNLVQSLKIELLELENRLSTSHRLNITSTPPNLKQLSESENDDSLVTRSH